jgi:hypothetical protein
MLTHVRLSLGRFVERYGLVLHLLLLLVVSYLALGWVLRSGWWGSQYRLGQTKVGEGGRPVARMVHVPKYVQFDEINGWRLLATLTDEAGGNLAVVSHGGMRIFLRQGDSVGPELTVRTVERGTLTIESGGSLHTLALVGERPQTSPTRGTRIDLSRRAAGELFPQLQWFAVPLGGKFVGMRLKPQGGSMAPAFGLRDGDTLESVNGLPVTGDDVRERLVERFRGEDAVNLGVRRDGRLVNVFVALYE